MRWHKLCKMAYERISMKDFIISNLTMENSFIEKIRNGKNNSDIYSEEKTEYADIYRLKITSEDAEKEYNCKRGTHVTLYTENICKMKNCEIKEISRIVSRELLKIVFSVCQGKDLNELSVLVAGIGNRQIASDSIGPRTVEKLNVTRHVKLIDPEIFRRSGLCSVAAVNCGVMGDTGMETFEVLKGIVSQICPDVVIAIDALAARACERLGSTIQMSDVGISPGAGIGNRRSEINTHSLGIPVISIGVPTVISASTVICDALEQCGYNELNSRMKETLNNSRNFFVAPKECDLITKSASELLALAIDGAFSVI